MNEWRKSSYSAPEGDNCVEVAAHGGIGVRDSKVPRPQLAFDRDAWTQFLARL